MSALTSGLQLALKEFSRGTGLFGLSRLTGTPVTTSGRELLAITLLFAVIITLAAFAITAGQSVSRNITQIMLGHISGAGTPIWVFGNVNRQGLDQEVLAAFQNGDALFSQTADSAPADAMAAQPMLSQLQFHPVSEIEHNDAHVRLPALDAWNSAPTPGADEVSFRGWALDPQNPIWRANAPETGVSRTIVLNRSLFEKHFDFEKYRAALVETLDRPTLATVPESLANVTDLKTLFLEVPFETSRNRLLPFEVIWADSLPALQKISMLIPYEAVVRSRAVRENPNLKLLTATDIDDYGDPGSILHSIEFRGIDDSAYLDQNGQLKGLETLVGCLGGSAHSTSTDANVTITLDAILSWESAKTCLSEAGLSDYPEMLPNFNFYPDWSVEGRFVTAACRDIRPSEVSKHPAAACRDDAAKLTFTPVPYFRTGLVFIPSHMDTIASVETILSFGDSRGTVFLIPETYRDALQRMDFAKKVLQYLGTATLVLGAITLSVVLFLQIHPIFSSRRKTYGLLLARGMPWWSIYLGAFLQIALAVIVAMLLAFGLLLLLVSGLESFFETSEAAQTATERFGLIDPRLIPIDTSQGGSWHRVWDIINSVVMSGVVTTLLGIVFTAATLLQISLTRSTLPVDLILGRSKSSASVQKDMAPAAA